MSFLGKKRTKRDEDDDKVRYNYIIFNNLLFKKEYERMFGIKDEEPKKEERKDIIKVEFKKENKDVKIIETKINLPIREKIKSKSYKKYVKNSVEEEKIKINLFPVNSNEEKKKSKKIEMKEEKEEKPKNFLEKTEEKNTSNNNIFDSKPSENQFKSFIENDKKGEKEKGNKNNDNENPKSIFSEPVNKNIVEKIENKPPQISLFRNINDIIENKDNFKEKSLFSNNTTSLFGTNNNQSLISGDNKISIFSNNNSLFSFGNNDNKSLFSNNVNNINNNNTPLFSNNNIFSNPFSQIKGESFLKNNFTNNNNETKIIGESIFGDTTKNENQNNDDEEDERDKPKTIYVAEPLKAQDYSNFSKIYNIQLNKLFLFNKNEKKFISKGNGFFSIEKAEEEKEKPNQAVVVFRNQTGNKIVEGLVDKKLGKVDIINKDFNYVVSFGIVMMIEGKPELGYLRIPFTDEGKAKELKEAFIKAISFIDGK